MTPEATPTDVDPRIARTRQVVVEATADLLAEQGFERLTIEAVAERSGVARSTIYRNWPDRADLFGEGFEQLCAFPPVPDLGSLEADLAFLAEELASGLSNSEWGRALPSLLGSAHHDPVLAEAQRRFSGRRRALTGAIFERAIERGEVGDHHDPGDLAELFASGFFFRHLMTRAPLDQEFIERQVATVLAAARS